LGGGAMMLLALAHAELGGMYPVAGGSARFPRYAFGGLIGFTSGWVTFLGAVTVAPIMVQATLLYASNYVSSLITVAGHRPVLTGPGYLVAATLLLFFSTINVIGAMVIAIVLYVALQLAFILALDPSSLAHGWGSVTFVGNGARFGPFAGLATGLGLGWLAVLIYSDAIVSPGGTGLLYTGASA